MPKVIKLKPLTKTFKQMNPGETFWHRGLLFQTLNKPEYITLAANQSVAVNIENGMLSVFLNSTAVSPTDVEIHEIEEDDDDL